MKNIKKLLIILFLFPNYNPAYSKSIDSSELVELFTSYVQSLKNNNENFQEIFQPETLVLFPKKDLKEFEEFNLLLTTLKSHLHHTDYGDKNSLTEIITEQFKEYLSKKIENLNFNTENEDITNEAKKLADAFQNYLISKFSTTISIKKSENTWANIANIIFSMDENPDQSFEIEYNNIAEIIKNYFTLIETKGEIASKILEELKDFFSREIEGFSAKNINFVLDLDIFKLFVSTGDIKAIFLAFMLQTQKDLKVLDLRNNKVGDFGMQIFSIALFNGSNLNLLNLSDNAIGNIGIKALKKATIDKNFKLPEKLILCKNKITDDVEKELIHIIKHAIYKHNINKNFFFILNLSDNYISINTRDAILESIGFNNLNNSNIVKFKNLTLNF